MKVYIIICDNATLDDDSNYSYNYTYIVDVFKDENTAKTHLEKHKQDELNKYDDMIDDLELREGTDCFTIEVGVYETTYKIIKKEIIC